MWSDKAQGCYMHPSLCVLLCSIEYQPHATHSKERLQQAALAITLATNGNNLRDGEGFPNGH
jgi:hypothetical protein